MEKKEYITPSMTEVKMETVNIIASSGTTPSTSGDYNVGDWGDEESSEF